MSPEIVQQGEIRTPNPLTTLALLFSYMPPEYDYSTNTGKWSEAIKWLRDKYDDQYPRLFDNMGFSPTGPSFYSREVDQALTLAYFGELVETTERGSGSRMRFLEQVQENVRVGFKSISDGTKAIVREMALDLVATKGEIIVVNPRQ